MNNRNLCKTVLSVGGELIPLIISPQDSKGLGLMNPSILLDKTRILLNLRNINYTLYHCEGEQLFNNRFGPLAYLHPENDLHLRTYNFLCELNPDNLTIKDYSEIDTSTFDKPPVWDFVGLEDIRLVRWEDKLYGCGVRRDTKPNGEGRMELSELIIKPSSEIKQNESPVKEVSRSRIEPPKDKNSYCEKNWMPILDMPYHFVKWVNPTEVVKVFPAAKSSQTVFLSNSHIPNLPDFRGGSQIINWRQYRMCVIHEVDLFKNKLEQKDGKYRHRFVIWDKNWNIVKLSDPFSFMDGEIEFACGMTIYKDNVLISFGFQDNAAFILKMPMKFFESYVGYPNFKNFFNWGNMLKINGYVDVINEEIFVNNIYEKFFKVQENDVIVDIGASVGPFLYSVLDRNFKQAYCIEPQKDLFETMKLNLKSSNITLINKGVADKDDEVLISSAYDTTEGRFLINGMRFDTFLKTYNIEHIDFLKMDCEGAEYDVFNDENLLWIKQNVRKIAAEIHLSSESLLKKFKHFRDTYLKQFEHYEVYSMDGKNDIKWDIWNNDKLFGMIMLYIDNTIPTPIIEIPIIETPIEKIEEISEVETLKKWKASTWPSLEITTTIRAKGCTVNCVFCPQKVLVNAYEGERIMLLENFKQAIDKVPKEIVIIFSGFCEPWLNKNCTDMVLYAYEKGHKIAVFTTGIGMSIEDFNKIKHIPFSIGPKDPIFSYKGEPMFNGGFTLHLPDNENYAKHPITEKYIKLLEHIKNSYNEISGIRIVCMGTVHDKIKHIFSGANLIDLWARANNVNKEMELKPELKALENKGLWKSAYRGEEPTTCGLDEKLYHNVLLPDGDIVLCCMDYNLDHVLGNLYTQEYEDILPELNTPFELCRFCENGVFIKNEKI
jgi:FkbM family methyltransferase